MRHQGPRERPWARIAAAVLVVLAITAVVAAAVDGRSSDVKSVNELTDEALATVDGVPQGRSFLGSANAPARITVLADLTSLRYADFEQDVLPDLVKQHVRPGRLSLELRTAATARDDTSLDDDSRTAAKLAQAAGLQNRMWQFGGVFAAQYVGILDDATADQMLAAVPGLDRRRARTDAQSPAVAASVDRATAQMRSRRVRGGLALTLQLPGRRSVQLPAGAAPDQLVKQIETQVAKLPARPGPAATPSAPELSPTSAPKCSDVETTGTKPVTCATSSALLTIVPKSVELPLPELKARLLSTTFEKATTPSGVQRNRARVAVRVRVVNRSDAPLFGDATNKPIYFVVGDQRVEADGAAQKLPGAFRFDQPLAPGATRTGELRFELAGNTTTRLENLGKGQLGVRLTDQPAAGEPVRVGVVRFDVPTG